MGGEETNNVKKIKGTARPGVRINKSFEITQNNIAKIKELLKQRRTISILQILDKLPEISAENLLTHTPKKYILADLDTKKTYIDVQYFEYGI